MASSNLAWQRPDYSTLEGECLDYTVWTNHKYNMNVI